MTRIACLGHTIDPLFLSKKVRSSLIVFIPKSDKRYKKYYKDFKTIEFDFKCKDAIEETSDFDVMSSGGFKKALQLTEITHFLVSHRSTKELFSLLIKLKITPLGNHYGWATRFENKDYFDRLLKTFSLPKPKTLSNAMLSTHKAKVVLQEVNSFGSFGTKIVTAKEALTINHKIKNKRSLLTREFVDGSVYGITLLIKGKSFALSALRQQCYFDESLLFAGVQWITSKSIPKKVRNSIQKSFKIIAQHCIKNNIEGILNFDFIISKNQKLSILECNPRPSSATPHLLSHKELIHGIDLSEFMTMQNFKFKTNEKVPNHHFQGALLDIMVPRNLSGIETKRSLKKLLVSQNKIKQKKLFVHLVLKPSFKEGDFLGLILSEKRLFSSSGTLLESTKLLYETITGISLRKT
jgi:hypothetical protein